MSDLYLFALASRGAQWLDERQVLVAGNVANSNTPGFRAQDLKPFAEHLNSSAMDLVATNPAHFTMGSDRARGPQAVETTANDASFSGNSVSLEAEMTKLGEINRDLSMNTNIRRLFHQMIMTATK